MASQYIPVRSGTALMISRSNAVSIQMDSADATLKVKDSADVLRHLVTKDQVQTLTNKTFTNPTITGGGGVYQTVGTPITASGAVPIAAGFVDITKAGVAALTLAAPVAGDEGTVITISSATAYAHTLTATGLLECGTAAVNVATFAAYPGAGLTLRATNLKWRVLASVAITFS
jgi:hypothetical protein